jgi:hypothetical protein
MQRNDELDQCITYLKTDYLRHNYSFIVKWENALRYNAQLASKLINDEKSAKETLEKIKKIAPRSQRDAFEIAASRQSKGQYRITVNLGEIKLITLSLEQMQTIATFLNQHCCPPIEIWNTCTDEENMQRFSKQWEVSEKIQPYHHRLISLKGPSLAYDTLCEDGDKNGKPLQTWLINTFNKDENKLLVNTLRQTDGKYECRFSFTSYDLASWQILNLANHYYKNILQNISDTVICNPSISEIKKHIGFFLEPAGGSRLALTCKKALNTGRDLIHLHKATMKK